MTSVIRVKRKRECEPAEALLFARKKMKDDYSNSEVVSGEIAADVIKIEEKVFHFAGTVEPEIAHSQHVVAERVKEAIDHRNQKKDFARSRKRKLPPKFKTSQFPGLPKIKHLKDATVAACQSVLGENCLKFSNEPQKVSPSKSSIQDCEDCAIYHESDHIPPSMTSGDYSVDEILCNNTNMLREKLTVSEKQQSSDAEFVYDLYYCRSTSADWDMLELLYVHPYKYTEHDLIDASDTDEDVYEDEDDSNDEENWRNDYPDEEDDSSKSSSSSDDDRERFVREEEDDVENDDDDIDGGHDDADDVCAMFGMRDWANFGLRDDFEADAFDYDQCDDGAD